MTVLVLICFFHVKQAIVRWMKLSKNNVPEDLRDQVLSFVSTLHYASDDAEFQRVKKGVLIFLALPGPLVSVPILR